MNICDNEVLITNGTSFYFRIYGLSGKQLDSLRYVFSWKKKYNPNARARMFGIHDDREFVITESGQYYPGLTWAVIEAIQKMFPEMAINISPAVDMVVNKPLYTGEFVDDILPGITPFDYQKEAAVVAMASTRCIIKLPTASGKSAVISYIIAHSSMKNKFIKLYVILVPTNALVIQFLDDMTSVYGMDEEQIGTWTTGSKTWTTDKQVLITTRDSLYNNKTLQKNTSKKITVLFNDECHLSGSPMLLSIQRKLKPYFVYGFTGTIPQDPYIKHKVIACNGPITYDMGTDNLQKKGYLPDCDTYLAMFDIYPVNCIDHHSESCHIYESYEWSDFIKKIVKKEKENGRNILVLVNYTKAGTILSERIGVPFLSGKTASPKDKKDIKVKMEQETGVAIIATYGIFSTGVSIKNLHTVVLGEPAQGFTTLVQSIGRSIRRHESKKEKPVRVIDLYTALKYSFRWATKKRKSYYTKENFDIKTIKENELWDILSKK